MVPARWDYWREIALVLSVGINLFLIGVLLGHVPFGSLGGGPGHEPPQARIQKALSPSGAAIINQALNDAHKLFEQHFNEAEAGFQHKSELLTKDPFDREAFLAENRNEQAEFAGARLQADQIFAAALARLSVEDRRALANLRLPPPLGALRPPRR